MKSNWEKVTLADVAILYDSLHQTPRYSENGYSMVRVTDIKRGYLDLAETKKVDENIYKEVTKKYKPQIGDIVFSRVGSYGNSSYVNEIKAFCLGQNTVCISPNQQLLDSFYLYSCLNSPFVKQQIDACVGGASQPTISLKNINALQIPYPSLPIQNKIAAILSNYDRLIENNTRRIKILEEMARSLYNEWFVNFRFPGYEQTKMVDSELGLIPEGWGVVRLGELASFQTGKLNSNAAKPNGDYPFFTCSQEIFRTDTYSFDTECILLAGNNANGIFHIKYFKGQFDVYQITYVIRTINQDKATNFYLYFAIRAQLEHLKNISTGAATKFLTLTILNNLSIMRSSSMIQKNFSSFICVIFYKIELLQAKNENLRQTRNLLLPKLISDEIDVGNLDINTGEVAV